MKKIVCLSLVLSAVLSFGSLSFAEDMKGMEDKGSMMKKGMMGKGMGMMGPMMMKMMMDKSVVATSDGGVVVLAGNKITKYDKDLNIVKEAEIKVDMEAMQKDMTSMMKMCPMMKGGMKDMDEESKEADEAQAPTAGSAGNATDHAAHH